MSGGRGSGGSPPGSDPVPREPDADELERGVACRLDAGGLDERRGQARRLRASIEEVRELEHGLALRFPGDAERALAITEFVSEERRCCPFFAFTLRFEPEEGPIWLEVRGPPGTREFLAEELLLG